MTRERAVLDTLSAGARNWARAFGPPPAELEDALRAQPWRGIVLTAAVRLDPSLGAALLLRGGEPGSTDGPTEPDPISEPHDFYERFKAAVAGLSDVE